MSAVAILSVLAPVSSASASAASGSNCGGTTIYKADGTPWVCTFDDEFSGTTLNTSKWSSWNKVDYLSYPNQCYYDDKQHVSVSDGYLNLSVTKLAQPQICTTPTGKIVANYGEGLVHTSGNFSQTYGRYEARIKFGGSDGVHDDFWLYPVDNNYPGQAEIDVAEPVSEWNTLFTATHVTGPAGTDVGGYAIPAVANMFTAFHTYDVVWTPTSITFSIDGTQVYSFSNWLTLPGFTAPAPFNQPFFMILQTTLDFVDSSTVLPSTTQVDYVRVWK